MATWIWYPGDYEIWLGNKMNNRRTDRGAYFPPFWKQDSHYVTVEFSTAVDLVEDEEITIVTEGDYNVKIDGKMLFGMPYRTTIAKGQHKINIKVHNQITPPALFIEGKTINTGADWNVTYEDKEWIDDSGKASDTSATEYQKAGYWNFNDQDSLPSEFMLERVEMAAVSAEKQLDGSVVFDFGKETFGYPCIKALKGNGQVFLYYGESREEALDHDHCETYDMLEVMEEGEGEYSIVRVIDYSTNNLSEMLIGDSYTLGNSKALRYVNIVFKGETSADALTLEYEYLPEKELGTFRCDNELLNKIWEIGVYTMQLTTREFFIDGIKRDRWVWSGDAAQSYLMNYYLFNDNETVKRTIWLLGGKAPITSHINTIMDYTFYWFNSIADYYLYSGDRAFLEQTYPNMKTMLDYVLGRTDEDGMVQGLTGDWVFIDWADKPMDKTGQLSFEQILFCRSLESIAQVAEVVGADTEEISKYKTLAANLRAKLLPFFWNEEKQAIVHKRGAEDIFKFSSMFAVIYNYLDEQKKQAVADNVLFNDDILKITTPYMRFYELEAMCMLGKHEQVMSEMLDYWGGMIEEGATSFWEKYVPGEHGAEKYAMYGRPFGKSLCHAWGASPIYLLGKYYLGVQPTSPGYKTYEVRPNLGGLKEMEGTVPTPFGCVYIKMNKEQVTVKSDSDGGVLIVDDKQVQIPANQEITLNYQ